MLQAANREDEGWLRVEDLENFPCEDLRTINQLWLHYSKGKFGFSVQKEIYQNLGGKREYNEEVWEKFADTVGWRVKNGWPDYKDITFDLSAPRRHLPGGDLWKVGKWEDGRWMVSGGGVRVLLSHRDL